MLTIQPITLRTKTCGKCKNEKPIDVFSKRGDSDGLRSECNDCKNESSREYKQRNKQKVDEANALYREQRAAELAERQRLWRLANPESYSQIHSKWKIENKDAVNASTHRRRARIKGNGGSFTAAEWAAIKLAQNHRCLMCDRQEPDIQLTIDHVIPISRGGINEAGNIQGLCKSCNSKKHRNTIDLRSS